MSEQTQKETQLTLDRTTIFKRLENLEERMAETEVTVDTLSTGQSIIYSALENAGLMKDGEPMQPVIYDPNKIKWTQAEGAKGKYERYPAQGQKAEAIEDYKAMLQDLKGHNGKMMKGPYFYWLFTDAAAIGRKLRKGKESKKGVSPDIEAVKGKFPSDLAELLSFEAEEQFTVLKPRRFLGSENFAKIATIVRELGGEYISAGKDSRFRILRKK